MTPKIVAVIPAHLASVRFPRKILFSLHGLPMVEHVRRRARLCDEISEVFVATCDPEIATVVKRHRGNVIVTGNWHVNGTSRVAEAIANISCSHVVLLQGDEPLLLPRHLDAFIRAVRAHPNGDSWNATGPIENEIELDRHSFVKCAIAPEGKVLFCFRRNPFFCGLNVQNEFVRKILGIIAYRRDVLLQLTKLPPSKIESAELIEQMRIIEYGYDLRSVPVSPSVPSINEPGEVEIVLEYLRNDGEQRALLERILE